MKLNLKNTVTLDNKTFFPGEVNIADEKLAKAVQKEDKRITAVKSGEEIPVEDTEETGSGEGTGSEGGSDLNAMEPKALKELATKLGIEYPGNVTKVKLIALIQEKQAEGEK